MWHAKPAGNNDVWGSRSGRVINGCIALVACFIWMRDDAPEVSQGRNVDCSKNHTLNGPEHHLWLENTQTLYGVENLTLAPGFERE